MAEKEEEEEEQEEGSDEAGTSLPAPAAPLLA